MPSTVQQHPGADSTRPCEPSPERLLQLGMGFWASKTLLSAVELRVFTRLATRPHAA
ncbi:methyltransferase, partial [bacterium]